MREKGGKERRKLTGGRAAKCKSHKGAICQEEFSDNTIEEKKWRVGKTSDVCSAVDGRKGTTKCRTRGVGGGDEGCRVKERKPAREK